MYVIPQPAQASLAVVGSAERFPVRRIYCVGRNYAAHAREMGNDPDREPPFFFDKPADCVLDSGAIIPYPSRTTNLHHEVELVVAIGRAGRNIALADTASHIWGAAVGVDLTRRDLQDDAKATRRPWDLSKGFDHSAPIAALVPIADVPSLSAGRITLSVNGETRQDADLADMIWPVADTIADLSAFVALEPGDLIMTGTPSGVAAIQQGDTMEASVDGLPPLSVSIGAPLS
ncbi:MAG: fumarylacetoacetate hydrolase family protein [Acuticoccus sp.]